MTDIQKGFGGGALSSFRQFGEITKTEDQPDGTIKVFGIAGTGKPDSVGETVLSSAMKAALPDYERFPALRSMHQLSAAGTVLDAQVDDDGITRIEALVVDTDAIKKVQTGVYRGFSIGGKVLGRDPTDRNVITKLKLNEISLVDRPCDPDATIDLWKADAATEEHEPMTTEITPWAPAKEDVFAKAEALATEAGKPGRRNDFLVKSRALLIAEHITPEAVADETAADPTVEEVAKADDVVADVVAEPVDEIVKADESDPVDLVAALEASIAKAVEPIVEPKGPPAQITPGLEDFAKGLSVIAAQPPSDDPLYKGLYTVSWLARVLEDVASIQRSTAWETEAEGDSSPIPAQLAASVNALGATLVAMASEEVAELLAGLPAAVALISPTIVSDDVAYAEKVVDLIKADADLLEKAGARNSKGDAKKIQGVHDASVELGAVCKQYMPTAADKAESADDLAKAARLDDVITKATAAIDKLTEDNADLRKRLEAVENTAAPAKGVVTVPAGLTVTNKAADVTGVTGDTETLTKSDVVEMISKMTPAELGDMQLRIALERPVRINGRA